MSIFCECTGSILCSGLHMARAPAVRMSKHMTLPQHVYALLSICRVLCTII